MIRLYIKYKLHELRENTINSAMTVTKIKTWFKIYFFMFSIFLVYSIINGFYIYIWYGMIVLLSGMIIIYIYKDYKSGDYMHWYRESVKQRIKEQDNHVMEQ